MTYLVNATGETTIFVYSAVTGFESRSIDFGLYGRQMLEHKEGESTISPDDRARAIQLMRINLLTGLGQRIFEQAVTDPVARQAIYDMVNPSRYTQEVPGSFTIRRESSIPTSFEEYRRAFPFRPSNSFLSNQ
jgi:hypothetical protein